MELRLSLELDVRVTLAPGQGAEYGLELHPATAVEEQTDSHSDRRTVLIHVPASESDCHSDPHLACGENLWLYGISVNLSSRCWFETYKS